MKKLAAILIIILCLSTIYGTERSANRGRHYFAYAGGGVSGLLNYNEPSEWTQIFNETLSVGYRTAVSEQLDVMGELVYQTTNFMITTDHPEPHVMKMKQKLYATDIHVPVSLVAYPSLLSKLGFDSVGFGLNFSIPVGFELKETKYYPNTSQTSTEDLLDDNKALRFGYHTFIEATDGRLLVQLRFRNELSTINLDNLDDGTYSIIDLRLLAGISF